MKNSTQSLCINAMFIALTFLATLCINIRLPVASNGGLVHLGNVPLFLGAMLFGKKTGAICGAFGMGMFDLVSGWTIWAPFTFVIVGAMGYAVGLIMENKKEHEFLYYCIAMAVALLIKMVGYYISEVILYQNFIAPIASMPGNIMQVGAAAVIVFPMAQLIKKAMPTSFGRNVA